jgi:hypothetical protein
MAQDGPETSPALPASLCSCFARLPWDVSARDSVTASSPELFPFRRWDSLFEGVGHSYWRLAYMMKVADFKDTVEVNSSALARLLAELVLVPQVICLSQLARSFTSRMRAFGWDCASLNSCLQLASVHVHASKCSLL